MPSVYDFSKQMAFFYVLFLNNNISAQFVKPKEPLSSIESRSQVLIL